MILAFIDFQGSLEMDITVWLWSTEGTMVHLVVKMSCGGDITAPGDHTAGCRAARMDNVWLIVVSTQPLQNQIITFLHPLI